MTDTDSPETEAQAPENAMPTAEPETNETESQVTEGIMPTAEAETSETEAQATAVDPQLLRLLEAVLFASAEPMDEAAIATRLPEGSDVPGLLAALVEIYVSRGVNLVQAGGKWLFRTAEDLAPAMRVYANPQRKLSRAAIETLAIVAYHQPITRAEMEEIRGVGLSKGTIDMLFEQGWITPRGRRQTPGKPVTWGSTEKFLTDFGIESIASLPGMDELKAAGLLDKRPAIQITDAALPEEEEPLSTEEQEKLAEDAAFLATLDSEAAAPVAAQQTSEGSADTAETDADESADRDDDSDNDGSQDESGEDDGHRDDDDEGDDIDEENDVDDEDDDDTDEDNDVDNEDHEDGVDDEEDGGDDDEDEEDGDDDDDEDDDEDSDRLDDEDAEGEGPEDDSKEGEDRRS